MVDVQSYKETGILWWIAEFIKKREYYGGLQSYKETGILWWICRVIKKREYYGGC